MNIQILTITKIMIDRVSRIEVAETSGHEEDPDFTHRSITITDEKGEIYGIALEASAKENLAIVEKPEDDWLTPKVYKGAEASEDALNKEE